MRKHGHVRSGMAGLSLKLGLARLWASERYRKLSLLTYPCGTLGDSSRDLAWLAAAGPRSLAPGGTINGLGGH